MSIGPGVVGAVVCCNGKMCACEFWDLNAYRFQWQCTLEHEKSHLDRAVCPHNGLVLTIPNPKYTNAADECIAYKVSIKCLKGFEGACASILNSAEAIDCWTEYYLFLRSRQSECLHYCGADRAGCT